MQGENQTTFSVLDIPFPSVDEGSYVVDVANVLSPLAKRYINSNLTLLDRPEGSPPQLHLTKSHHKPTVQGLTLQNIPKTPLSLPAKQDDSFSWFPCRRGVAPFRVRRSADVCNTALPPLVCMTKSHMEVG